MDSPLVYRMLRGLFHKEHFFLEIVLKGPCVGAKLHTNWDQEMSFLPSILIHDSLYAPVSEGELKKSIQNCSPVIL